jgi:hypothetical protein
VSDSPQILPSVHDVQRPRKVAVLLRKLFENGTARRGAGPELRFDGLGHGAWSLAWNRRRHTQLAHRLSLSSSMYCFATLACHRRRVAEAHSLASVQERSTVDRVVLSVRVAQVHKHSNEKA